MKTIAIAGTFDTKGKEYLYVKGLVEELGLHALTIHTGVFEPEFTPDVSNAEVAAAARIRYPRHCGTKGPGHGDRGAVERNGDTGFAAVRGRQV